MVNVVPPRVTEAMPSGADRVRLPLVVLDCPAGPSLVKPDSNTVV